MCELMQRITVVGTPGAGKTTLAQRLGAQLGLPFVELDTLFWGPGWTPSAPEPFRNRVSAALTGERWAVGGNYSTALDLIWDRSDTLIWLDYALPLVLTRLVRRTIRRIATRERLWAGNVETWRDAFFSRDSLLLFAITTHHTRRGRFMRELTAPASAHLIVRRFETPAAAERWRAELES